MKEEQTIKDVLEKLAEAPDSIDENMKEAYKLGFIRGYMEGWNNARELFNTDNETQEEG